MSEAVATHREEGVASLPLVAVALGALGLLCAGIYSFFVFHTGYVLLLLGISLVVLAVAAALMWRFALKRGGVPASAFIVALSAMGLFFCAVFPPGAVPDEGYHYVTSYWYTDVMLGEAVEGNSVSMRNDDYVFLQEVIGPSRASRGTFETMFERGTLALEDGSSTMFTPTFKLDFGSNLPQQKLGSVLGVLLARLLGLGSIPLFYLGRLGNLLTYVVLVGVAYKVCSVGRNILIVVAMLPMSLHLAASFSYDATVMGMAMLLCALVFRALDREKPFTYKHQLAIGVIAGLLAPCKVIYMLLAGTVFAIPPARFESRRQELLFKVGVAGVSLLALAVVRAGAIIGSLGLSAPTAADVSATLDYRGAEAGVFYTLGDLLLHPLHTIKLFAQSLVANGDFYITTTVGGSLGWFQSELVAPCYVVYAFVFAGLASIMRSYDDRFALARGQRLLFGGICILGLLAVLVVFALSWTFNTEEVVMGIQGRYFIPFLMVLGLAFRPHAIVCKKPSGSVLFLGMYALVGMYLVRLLGLILSL